jgi:hypothetical protein
MGFARLAQDLRVSEVVFPVLRRRNAIEKNWQFFSADGRLYAVYSIAPHRVLSIEGSEAYTSNLTSTSAEWSGGELRGGASPVRIGDRFLSFFHSSVSHGRELVYNVGVYTFEASAPFRVLAVTPHPIARADVAGIAGNGKRVLFPCGAMLKPGEPDRWIVSAGIDDRNAELFEVDGRHVEECLRPAAWASRWTSCGSAPVIDPVPLTDPLSIDGWCTLEKSDYLRRVMLHMKPSLALEVGVWKGRSLIVLGQAMTEVNAATGRQGLVIGVDPYERARQVAGCVDPRHLDWAKSIDWDSVYLDALANVKRFCPDTCLLIRSTSAAVAGIVRAGLDLVHIDGCHSVEHSCADVNRFLPLVRVGGLVILDDINWDTVKDAYQILRDNCEAERIEETWAAFRKI